MHLIITPLLLICIQCFQVCQGSTPLPIDVWRGKRAMFVSAHPDDIEAAAGGTVAMLAAQGTAVEYVIFTNGDKGCANSMCVNASSESIAVIRQEEAMKAGVMLGVNDVRLLDYEDMMLVTYDRVDTAQALVSAIRRFRPHVVFSWYGEPNLNLQRHDGWDDLGFHPDHQASGRIAMYSLYAAGLERMWPHLGAPWHASQYYQFDFVSPPYYVPLDQGTLNAKIKAFAAHASQLPNPAVDSKVMLTGLAQRVANSTNGYGGAWAEGFRAFF